MGLRLRQSILQIIITISLATCVGAAQSPEEDVFPEAPMSAGSEAPGAPAERSETPPVGQPIPIGMTTKEKYGLAYRRIVSPQLPLKALFVSGWEVGTGTGPDFATNGWVPFGQRVGYNAASISTTIFFNTAVVPALVHQDPRFFPLGSGTVKTRVLWAVKSEFVGFRDDGSRMPNYANLVGFALASLVMNSFAPGENPGAGDVAKGYAGKIGFSTGLNVAREFRVFDRVKAIAHHSKSAEE
jgi:hypothetical protein